MLKIIEVFISSREVLAVEEGWLLEQIKQEKSTNDEPKESIDCEGKIIWSSGYLCAEYHIQEGSEEPDREEEGG